MIIKEIAKISTERWQQLIEQSPVATWFQTSEAYYFYESLLEAMNPFLFAVERNTVLKGVIVGYITQETNALKQYFMRRAIIVGGPLLAHDISDEELTELLTTAKDDLKQEVIYVESRNFNDYSCWQPIFERCGFAYQPHLNFHIDTTSLTDVQTSMNKNCWKHIRLSLEAGATIIERPSIEQVKQFYQILKHLYQTKVRTPLFPFTFFEELYSQQSAHFLLIDLDGEIIGGICCVCLMDKTLYEWFVCGDDKVRLGVYPSTLATWAGIKYAAEHGLSRFDFMGAGKPDEPYGVRDFKARFGGQLVEHGRFLHINNHILYNIGKLGVKFLKIQR